MSIWRSFNNSARRPMRNRLIGIAAVSLLIAALLLTGCSLFKSGAENAGGARKPGVTEGVGAPAENEWNREQPGTGAGNGTDAGKPEISPRPAETKHRVTLYFGDNQAMYLIPEEREVTKGDETLEAVIIRELIKGPRKAGSTRTIPEGTRLLSVSVVNGVAYVNFSREFQTKHWGGSAGERMTIFSVVNSLCKLPGIQKVQFLLEGNKQEAILGHGDTSRPISPDWNLVQK